jgi:hypothetical protein
MMIRADAARMRRLKVWIIALSLLPTLVSGALSKAHYAAGFTSGGLLVLLNFMGTERVVRNLFGDSVFGRIIAAFLQLCKLGLTAAAIAGLIHWRLVSPLALLIGLSTLPAALMFDFFLFPIDKGEEKEI